MVILCCVRLNEPILIVSLHQTFWTAIARIRNGASKLHWGIRAVGLLATARGMARWLEITLLRPPQAEAKVSSGYILEFKYPSQFPSAIVMFGDLIDPEFAFMQQIAQPDWIVVDVGAAIGQFAIFAAKLPCTIVHAYEPSGANTAMLRHNVKRNDVLGRVQVHQLALSNVNGESIFETAGNTWVSQLRPDAHGGEVVLVRTLTSELQRLGLDRLNVLKVNVAGFEPEVLEGAMPLLADGKIEILILLLGLPSLKWYAEIAGHGYRFFYYHPVERLLYEVTSFDASSVLDYRPWPARNIIGIHFSMVENNNISSMVVRKPRATIEHASMV